MKHDIYTNIHFIDQKNHVNKSVGSKQSVVKEYPSNVPKFTL